MRRTWPRADGGGFSVHTLASGSMITFFEPQATHGARAATDACVGDDLPSAYLVSDQWVSLCHLAEAHDRRAAKLAELPRAERPAAYAHLRRSCTRIRALAKRVFDAVCRLDEPALFMFHIRPRPTGLVAAWLAQRLADYRRYEQSRYGIIIHDEVAFTSPSPRAGASADGDTDTGTTAWS